MIADDVGASDEEWLAACDEALELVSDVLLWKLQESRWEQVLAAIAEVAEAVEAGSLDVLWRGIADLELCSPLRVSTGLGDTPRLPATRPIRVRAAKLTGKLRSQGHPRADDGSDTRSQGTASTTQ